MTITEVIRARRSIRKFKPGAVVTDDQIKLLLEAAMLAPSACNTRPWEYIRPVRLPKKRNMWYIYVG